MHHHCLSRWIYYYLLKFNFHNFRIECTEPSITYLYTYVQTDRLDIERIPLDNKLSHLRFFCAKNSRSCDPVHTPIEAMVCVCAAEKEENSNKPQSKLCPLQSTACCVYSHQFNSILHISKSIFCFASFVRPCVCLFHLVIIYWSFLSNTKTVFLKWFLLIV